MVNKNPKNKISYLSDKQQDYLEERKTLKKIRQQNLEYQKERQLEKSESTFGRIKSGVSSATGTLFKPVKRISQPTSFQIGQQLNSEQSFLQDLFGHGQRCMMPSEETLPPATINHSLMPNFGGIEEDDGYTTANNFGMGKFRGQTGSMFGI